MFRTGGHQTKLALVIVPPTINGTLRETNAARVVMPSRYSCPGGDGRFGYLDWICTVFTCTISQLPGKVAPCRGEIGVGGHFNPCMPLGGTTEGAHCRHVRMHCVWQPTVPAGRIAGLPTPAEESAAVQQHTGVTGSGGDGLARSHSSTEAQLFRGNMRDFRLITKTPLVAAYEAPHIVLLVARQGPCQVRHLQVLSAWTTHPSSRLPAQE